MRRYQVVVATTNSQTFEHEVSKLLSDGWFALGGMAAIVQGENIYMMQALVSDPIAAAPHRLEAALKARIEDALAPVVNTQDKIKASWPLDETVYAFALKPAGSYGHAAWVWLKWCQEHAVSALLAQQGLGPVTNKKIADALENIPGALR